MKKVLSLMLAVLTAFSALSISVSATEPIGLIVEDLLKHDTDTDTYMCRTVEILIQRQFRSYDSTKEITFRTANDAVAAVCKPYPDNICKFDLYTPDGSFGVRLDPTRLYYLTIPEGAYRTDDGTPNAAYRGAYDGVHLSDNDNVWSVLDLGISEFLAMNVAGNKLYTGRISIGMSFENYRVGNLAVTLLRKTSTDKNTGKARFEVIGAYPVTAFRQGSADVSFGGVEIDRYSAYELHVEYGTFFGSYKTVNADSKFALSGKALLGQREVYPAIDLLIRWFGAEHWTVRTIVTALDLLSKIKLVDKALAKDVKDYVNAKKSR